MGDTDMKTPHRILSHLPTDTAAPGCSGSGWLGFFRRRSWHRCGRSRGSSSSLPSCTKISGFRYNRKYLRQQQIRLRGRDSAPSNGNDCPKASCAISPVVYQQGWLCNALLIRRFHLTICSHPSCTKIGGSRNNCKYLKQKRSRLKKPWRRHPRHGYQINTIHRFFWTPLSSGALTRTKSP